MGKYIFIFPLLIVLFCFCSKNKDSNKINLSGEWSFKIDPHNKGIVEKWFSKSTNEIVKLPGSMAENDKGYKVDVNTQWTGSIFDSSWFFDEKYAKYRKPGNIKVPFWLQPTKYYVGAAWYQKDVDIPENWSGKNINLFLERCHWETKVWIDTVYAGMRNSLGTPDIFDLTRYLSPGKHTISIRVDNSINDIDVGINSHSITDHTQGNWNGITGSIYLKSSNPLSIADIQIFPQLSDKSVKIKAHVTNSKSASQELTFVLKAVALFKNASEELPRKERTVTLNKNQQDFEFVYSMGDNPALWDEFNPNLYSMNVELRDDNGLKDNKKVTFGMREIKAKGTYFTINSKRIFLRGTLDCAIFPKTGYPPTDVTEWLRNFKIAKNHGLNHIRFHSWCPPEAAFEAADRLGLYLHVECSSWANWSTTIGDGLPIDKFIYDEGDRILNAYGNHPSFCFLLQGNEPGGDNYEIWFGKLVKYWKEKDPRRLYSSAAGWPIIPENDFHSLSSPRIQHWGEGLNSIINAQPPNSNYDWSEEIAKYKKPIISHEIGQWCVYPDFKEIDEYSGTLKAKNFEIFKETLAENGLSYLADSFLVGSGKLQALCYKAEIEAALRTPGFAGFQLLSLYDFPGQGTALVGVLNSFWEEKGYISAKEFRRFCNTTVPLVRLSKMVYLSDELLNTTVEVAHFGQHNLQEVIPSWKILKTDGAIYAEGKLPKISVPDTNNFKIGEITQSFTDITTPVQMKLEVTIADFKNNWNIWVYPKNHEKLDDQDIIVTQVLNQKVIDLLQKGGKVLLTPKKGSINPEYGGDIQVGFSSIFWNTAWTHGQPPHTLGILCDPGHPAFSAFPTEFHSDWQWWDGMSHSNAIILNSFPQKLNPIVRIIDDWFENRSLGLVFEVKVGNGKMIISGIDLLTNLDKRPEARQLLYSLKKYMNGKNFNPDISIDAAKIKRMFENNKI